MRAFFLGAILFPFTVFAFTPNFGINECSRFWIEGEWLYFSPTSETSYYGIRGIASGGPFISGERIGNRFDEFFSGYRVAAAYLLGNDQGFIGASWTHLHASHNDSNSAPAPEFIIPTLGTPGLYGTDTQTGLASDATDDKEFTYHALDIVIGQPLFCWNSLNFTGFLGLHYAYLSSNEDFSYNLIDPFTAFIVGELRETFKGIGPEIGISFQRNLGYGLSLESTAVGAILIGQPEASTETIRTVVEGASFSVFNEKAWRMVPYGDIRVGFNYLLNPLLYGCGCSCLDATLKVGYEVLVYFNGLGTLTLTDFSQIGFSIDQYRNVTMHGPFVALTISF
jgi:hypothetical protein